MTFYGFLEPHVGLTEPHVGLTSHKPNFMLICYKLTN